MSHGWAVDTNQCISCRACELACKAEYQIQAGQGRRRRVIEKTVDETGTIRTFFLSLACNHCNDPACIKACPKSLASGTGTAVNSALWKDTTGVDSAGMVGVVHFTSANCIGCRRCEWACPYGAPQFDPDSGTIHKCELCFQRRQAWINTHGGNPDAPVGAAQIGDKRRQPACVATCLGRAIVALSVDSATVGADNIGSADSLEYADQYTLNGSGLGDRNFYRAGAGSGSAGDDAVTVLGGGVGDGNRGSAYVASTQLTGANLRICNRVYKNKTGGVE